MSTDDRLERILAEVLDSGSPSRLPDRLIPETLRAVRRVPRWPRWLAYLKEPPMRVSSRVAVGSPTARVMAIVAATLLLAVVATGAVVGATTLLTSPTVLVVAQDGTGTHETISDALATARGGDTILVRPGVYPEAVIVDKDITITGDGPRQDIVIEAPSGGPTVLIQHDGTEEDPYAILLDRTRATLSGLTLRGQATEVVAAGGSPTLEGLAFEGTGIASDGSSTSARGNSVIISRGSTAVLRDNILVGGGPIGIFDGSSPLIEGNTLTDGANILGAGPGDGTLIRRNTIRDAVMRAIGLAEFHGTSPTDRIGAVTIEANVIENAGSEAIDARSGTIRIVDNSISGGGMGINTGSAARVHIEGNTVKGATGTAISTEAAADVRIERNDLVDNRIAVSLTGGSVRDNSLSGNELGINLNGSAEVAGNRIVDGGTGLASNTGRPAITDNAITGNDLGVLVVVGSDPVLSGNTICDNDRNLVVPDGAQPPATATNEICADLTEEQAS